MPADTTMMTIVHDAIRRDLTRLRAAADVPDNPRRVALADHAGALMRFLHDHHVNEDTGLWPLVVAANPAAAPVLAEMDGEHAVVLPLADAVVTAAAGYRAGEAGRADLCAALDALAGPLFEHLAHEERTALPVVAASITDRQWHDWEQRANVKGRPVGELGVEGHFLLDGLDPDRASVLLHQVPAPLRIVLLRGFRSRYRRECAARWGPGVDVGPLSRG
jgi:hypothetical protein